MKQQLVSLDKCPFCDGTLFQKNLGDDGCKCCGCGMIIYFRV